MGKVFRTKRTIPFEADDLAGLIYFPREIQMLVGAMEEMFRDALGLPWDEMLGPDDLGLPAVELQVSFRAPLRLGEQVEIAIRVAELEARKFTLVYEVTKLDTGEVAATMRQVIVPVEVKGWVSRPLPDKYHEALRAYADDG